MANIEIALEKINDVVTNYATQGNAGCWTDSITTPTTPIIKCWTDIVDGDDMTNFAGFNTQYPNYPVGFYFYQTFATDIANAVDANFNVENPGKIPFRVFSVIFTLGNTYNHNKNRYEYIAGLGEARYRFCPLKG